MKSMQSSMFSINTRRIFTACVFVCGLFFIAPHVMAESYQAGSVTITGNGDLQMEPGEVARVSVTFKNSGSADWYNDGDGYISLYTYGPKYRKSVFDPGTWLGPDRVKRIRETVVKPGETASMSFELHAPITEGTYQETFKLASEDTAWLEGGEITFNITVAQGQEEMTLVDAQDGYGAQLVLQSASRVKIKAGKSVLITVGFKNTGTNTWKDYSLNEMDVALASTSINFNHPSWSGSQLAYAVKEVKPGEIAYLDFAIMAPDANGIYMAEFQFKANDVSVDNAIFELPVEVTGGAVTANDDAQEDAIVSNYKEQEEPMLRVGILIVDEETDNQVVITCQEEDFELRDTEGNILAKLDAGEEVTAYYANGKYYYDLGRGTEVSSYGLRFIPSVENAVMTVTNFDYRVTRNSKYAYNTYRNIIELRYNDYKDRTWLINELPIEMYLRGLAETSNASPHEYQKALITSARTYAYYHFYHGTKRGKEFMHVVGYSDDQVYRGYEHEVQSPTIVQAVVDTRGMVVTYEDALAITPYFSRSAGQTYDWSEVWGGSVPWCVGVSVPWDEGKTLWGHGIGMSASGALGMANDGYLWDEILKYFYTGIEVEQWWK